MAINATFQFLQFLKICVEDQIIILVSLSFLFYDLLQHWHLQAERRSCLLTMNSAIPLTCILWFVCIFFWFVLKQLIIQQTPSFWNIMERNKINSNTYMKGNKSAIIVEFREYIRLRLGLRKEYMLLKLNQIAVQLRV